MTQTTVNSPTADEQKVLDAIDNELVGIRRGLDKEGAGLDIQVDTDINTLVASLERHRIVCEGCLLPEHLVQTILNKALDAHGLKYKVETRNWLLTEGALS